MAEGPEPLLRADAAVPALLERADGLVLRALASHEALPPVAVGFLIRRYASTGDPALAEALEPCLAESVARAEASPDLDDQADWLEVVAEAATISTDERLAHTLTALVSKQMRQWTDFSAVGPVAHSLGAVFHAGRLDCNVAREILVAAVDRLESLIDATYEPGCGAAAGVGNIDPSRQEPPALLLRLQLRLGAALVDAYHLTGRVPYAMLAEELVGFAKREYWDGARGCFGGPSGVAPVDNALAARLIVSLAGLYDAPDYREVAVAALEVQHEADAASILDSILHSVTAGTMQGDLRITSIGGLAAADWLDRRSKVVR